MTATGVLDSAAGGVPAGDPSAASVTCVMGFGSSLDVETDRKCQGGQNDPGTADQREPAPGGVGDERARPAGFTSVSLTRFSPGWAIWSIPGAERSGRACCRADIDR